MTITTARPTRRTLVRGAAWSVPVISIAAAAPAFASSTTASTLGAIAPMKWGTGNNPKHVSFDLQLNNGSLEIDSVVIEFTYTKINGGSYLGQVFVINGYDSSPATSWSLSSIPLAGAGVVTATNLTNIAPNAVLKLHTDFSGADNSSGNVAAKITITYVGGTTQVLNTGALDWAQGNEHVHPA